MTPQTPDYEHGETPAASSQLVHCADGLLVSFAEPLGGEGLTVGGHRPIAPPSAPATEATMPDGRTWRRLWVEKDRLVAEFVGAGFAEIAGGTIRFDTALDPGVLRHLVLDHLVPLELTRRGHLVLHAAIASTPGGTNARGGVALAGPSGAGKSTLTAFLGSQGWNVGGDDGITVTHQETLRAQPTYSSVRLTPEGVALLKIPPEDSTDIAGKKRLVNLTSWESPAFHDLSLVAFIEPTSETEDASFTVLSPVQAHAHLFGCCFHLSFTDAAELERINDALGELARNCSVGVLSVPRGLDGLAAAEQTLLAELS